MVEGWFRDILAADAQCGLRTDAEIDRQRLSTRGEKAPNWTLITCQDSANSRANVWPFFLNTKGRRDAFISRQEPFEGWI